MSARIWLRRAHDEPTRNDGYRVLVDRIWPRGVSKADARIDQWLREVAPSDELRRWFGHDPQRWDEFGRSYRAELDDRGASSTSSSTASTGAGSRWCTGRVMDSTTMPWCSATCSNNAVGIDAAAHPRAHDSNLISA